ncbi:unnamed protein product [Closterium sp. Naga37s-1]|nr:unnamed protein product [Closterium sp. Naga37s-1]
MLVGKVFSLHNTTYLCPGNSTDTNAHLLMAKKVIFTFCPVLQVFLQGNNSDQPDITLSGSFFEHEFKVTTSSGILLAEVGRDLFFRKDERKGGRMESQMQVPRVQPYVVVGSQYCAPYETVLVMKDKIFSVRDAKEVRDANNQLQFRIADKLLSIRDRTTIQNAMGESVCTIVSKLLSLRDTAYLCPGNSTNTDNYLLKARKSILSFKPVLKVDSLSACSQPQPLVL